MGLVLKRKTGRAIVLTHAGVTIRVEFNRMDGPDAVIYIDSPPEVSIWRDELYNEMAPGWRIEMERQNLRRKHGGRP